MRRMLAIPAVVALLAVGPIASCKPKQQAHERTVMQTSHEPSDLASQDREFLERATEGNNAEVAIGSLVRGRSADAAVRAYGEMMTHEHSAANLAIAAIAKKRRVTLTSSLGEHQSNFDRLVDLTGSDFDSEFVRVMLEDHQTALALYQSEVASGTDPDLRQYAGAMIPKIAAHLERAEALRRPR